jgi:hypothetical protein
VAILNTTNAVSGKSQLLAYIIYACQNIQAEILVPVMNELAPGNSSLRIVEFVAPPAWRMGMRQGVFFSLAHGAINFI